MAFSLSSAAHGAALGTQINPGLGSVLGGILGGFFGKGKKATPSIPVEPVDLSEQQKKAIQANIQAAPDIEKLLSRANEFEQQQALSLMEKAMPGYGKLSKGLTSTAQGLLERPYDLPTDVQQNLQRIAAERGISRGTSGQFNQFSLLRDLGLNQLEYGQNRINQAQNITNMLAGLAPRVNPMSPISFYATPQQFAANAMQQNLYNQAAMQSGAAARTAQQNFATQNAWDALGSLSSMIGGKIQNKQKSPFEVVTTGTGFNPAY